MRIHDRKGSAVVLSKKLYGHLLVAMDIERLKGKVHQRRHLILGRREEHLLDIDLVDELS